MPNTLNSQTETDRKNEASTLPDETTSSDYMLDTGVHRFRSVVGSVVMASTLIGAMMPIAGDGLQVHTFQFTNVDTTEQKRLLDKYNSTSGNLTVLMTPLDVFLSMFVAVASLCICLNEAGSEDLTMDFNYYRQDEVMQSAQTRP